MLLERRGQRREKRSGNGSTTKRPNSAPRTSSVLSASIMLLILIDMMQPASATMYSDVDDLTTRLEDRAFRFRAFSSPEGFVSLIATASIANLPPHMKWSAPSLIAFVCFSYYGLMPLKRRCRICGRNYGEPFQEAETRAKKNESQSLTGYLESMYHGEDDEEPGQKTIRYRMRGAHPKEFKDPKQAHLRCACFDKRVSVAFETCFETMTDCY